MTLSFLSHSDPAFGQISVHNDVDEGQECWRIETPTATYFYHIEGAGFSSIVDRHGFDWLEYHPGGGSAGEHRGIPNMVFQSNGNFFHPGHSGEKGSKSTIEISDEQVVITSVSSNGAWKCRWEIVETHATMTVEKAGGAYWFLYEGTPGGRYDTDLDWYMLSDGTREYVDTDSVGDIPSPEWIVLGEDGLETVLFIAHHEDDEISDTYMHWHNMTVFGFGRAGREDYTPKMTAQRNTFTIGFLESTDYRELSRRIADIVDFKPKAKPVEISKGPSVTDADGNSYATVRIGTQLWMAENLRTTRFADGTLIPEVAGNEEWTKQQGPALCGIEGKGDTKVADMGLLYNWHAANSGKLAPEGWRVPTDEDWKILEEALGLSDEDVDVMGWRGNIAANLAGGGEHWIDGTLKEDARFASTGFAGFPAGNRIAANGLFGNLGSNAYWWTSTEAPEGENAWFRKLYYGSTHMIRSVSPKNYGFSVRCIKE